MKRFFYLATLLFGMGLVMTSCEKEEASSTLIGIWEAENGMNRIEFSDNSISTNAPNEDGDLTFVPYTKDGNSIIVMGGLAWMTIDKLTSSRLDISNVDSFFGDGADSWLKKLNRVTGLEGYESKIGGKWTVTKAVYYEDGVLEDETEEEKGATFTFSNGILRTHYPGNDDNDDDMGSYSVRAGAIVLDKTEEVLNIESISSSSMKLKVLDYSNRKAAFYDDEYAIIELKKEK